MTEPTARTPRLRGLSQDQVRGFACVTCGIPLPDGGVELAPQQIRIVDRPVTWRPRACEGCAP